MELDLKTFASGWWYKDVPKLLLEADKLFAKAGKVKWESSANKIFEARGWEPAKRVVEPNLQKVIQGLGFFYFSKFMLPGPCFVFPLRDIAPDLITRAQIKPCYSVIDDKGKLCKYMNIGPKISLGPNWLGNDPDTIAQIIKQRRVVLVEGGFDLLACRLLRPDIPFLSPLKKSLGEEHEIYLRMLGVKQIYLLFDNEAPKEGRTLGGGNMSMHSTIERIKTMKVEMLLSPAGDPSACLQSLRNTRALQNLLEQI